MDWDPDFKEKTWYFYTNRSTLWRLRLDESYRFREYAEKLRDFVWYDKEQDYEWFLNHLLNASETDQILSEFIEVSKAPYSIDDLIASGVFLTPEAIRSSMLYGALETSMNSARIWSVSLAFNR